MAQAAIANITDCPAARLAREAVSVIAAMGEAELKNRSLFETLQERLDTIEDGCGYVRATSALGALYQAVLLHSELEAHGTWMPSSGPRRRAARRFGRLTASLATFVEAGADMAAASQLRFHYFDRYNDDLAILDGHVRAAPVSVIAAND